MPAWCLRIIRKRLDKVAERFHRSRKILQLYETPSQFVSRFGPKFRRKLRRAQIPIQRRGLGIFLLLIKCFRFKQLRLVGAFGRWIRRQELVHRIDQGGRIGVININ